MFKFADFIAPRITLYHNNLLNHAAISSIILSFITIIIIIVFSVIFSLDFIFHRNPTSFYYKRYIDDIGTFPLNSSSLFHFITLLNDANDVLYDDSLLSVIGVHISEEQMYELKYDRTKFDHWIYGPCDESDINDKIKYMEEDNIGRFKKSYCIKYYFNSESLTLFNVKDQGFKYPTVEHGQANEKSIYYGIFLKLCENFTYYNSDLNKCQEKDKLLEFLEKLNGYAIYFLDKNIDINNYKEPFQYFINKISNKFNLISYTSNNLNFNTALLKTIKGKVFDLIEEETTYIYQLNEKLVTEKDAINDNIYGTIYFWMQNMQEVYQRKYKKIQDLSASIGGIINLIIVLAKIIYKFFEKYVLINDLIFNLKIKCNEVVREIYKTDFSEIKINQKNYENSVKMNNYLDSTSKNKINMIESPQLNKINQLKPIKQNSDNSKKFSVSLSKVINLSSLSFNKFKKVSFLQILMSNFNLFKKRKDFIDKLENFRKKIISEEGMFTTYYILLTLINKNNPKIYSDLDKLK
jgi:hypothetical protein